MLETERHSDSKTKTNYKYIIILDFKIEENCFTLKISDIISYESIQALKKQKE
jgi:hypothetical protein